VIPLSFWERGQPVPLILYDEGPCLAVFKPAGLLTQAPSGIDSLETRIKSFIKEREGKSGNVYLGVPHRLDRPVSGVLLVARHVRACRRLSEQFEARTVRKVYWACVAGQVTPESGVWQDHLRKIPGAARVEVVGADQADAQQAILRYRTLGAVPSGTWLEIELETGRTHQIRVQAASRGHPVFGDAQYGSPVPFGAQHDDVRLRAIALHAREIAFHHPMTHEPVTVVAPLTHDWKPLELAIDEQYVSPP
jgi:23S rRNA pseudouridine1911/1915/1917 synthase